jgi:hypothetical protein
MSAAAPSAVGVAMPAEILAASRLGLIAARESAHLYDPVRQGLIAKVASAGTVPGPCRKSSRRRFALALRGNAYAARPLEVGSMTAGIGPRPGRTSTEARPARCIGVLLCARDVVIRDLTAASINLGEVQQAVTVVLILGAGFWRPSNCRPRPPYLLTRCRGPKRSLREGCGA